MIFFVIVYFCTDINPHACRCTYLTGVQNKVRTFIPPFEHQPTASIQVDIHVINGSLAAPLQSRLSHKIDIVIFNPPYVPTTDEEINDAQSSRNIGGSWAGGSDGMQVTNILLDSVEVGFLPCLRVQTQQKKFRPCYLPMDVFTSLR